MSQTPRQVGGAGGCAGEATPQQGSSPRASLARPALPCGTSPTPLSPAPPVTSSVTGLRPSGQGPFPFLQTAAAAPLGPGAITRVSHHHPSGETSRLSSLEGIFGWWWHFHEAPCPPTCVTHQPGGHRACVRRLELAEAVVALLAPCAGWALRGAMHSWPRHGGPELLTPYPTFPSPPAVLPALRTWRKRLALVEKDHVMVVSTSPFVPNPGPAECPEKDGAACSRPAAGGPAPTHAGSLANTGGKFGRSMRGSVTKGLLGQLWDPLCFPPLSPCSSCYGSLLLQPMSCPGVPLALPAPCLPSQHPSPAASAPQNATSSAAGCLMRGAIRRCKWLPCLSLLLSQDSMVPALSLHRGWGGCPPPPGTSPHQSLSQEAWEGVAGLGGGSAADPALPPPAGLPPGALLPAGLRGRLLPQGWCPFPLHLWQHPLCPRPTSRLEGPAPQDVHERAQRRAGVSDGDSPDGAQPIAAAAPQGLWGPWGPQSRDRGKGVV